MKVCITEKPSVARDIARLLGANDRHEGYFEGNGYQVTWTFGHLCCLKEPNDYTERWKWWSLASLPMIPPRFGIKLIEDEGYKKQFKVIETLIAGADEVINCGDAGQEGELIQRWVYQKARCEKPVKRLWISSLTDESIQDGFQHLQDSTDFDNLYYAGLSRAIGDWILGMNATRLYTLKYAKREVGTSHVLSIGRVQTPTLALIVARQREIENFVPEDYWEIKTTYRDTTFNSTKGKFKTEGDASEIVESIKAFPLTVTSVEKKKGREAPPRLFDLTSLQVECNKKFGYSADETLRLIQSLYEKKVTTYPRVDTTFLSDDIYPKVPGIMQAMKPYAPLTDPLLKASKLPKSKKVFDNSKVTDHHAIIPTNVDPASVFLTREEKLVYDLVAKRFISAFYPDCEFSTTTVMAQVNTYEFKATGKEILKDGWRVIYNKDKTAESKEKDEDDNAIMATFVKGESGPHEPSLQKKTTQPPKYYTEGTLLRAMETAGKLVDDDELRDAMKENGIGRPSTRASIIETLHKRHYIAKQRKSLIATAAGIQLIDTIKEELLKSAKLTGLWENKLRKIERGEFSAQQFIDELKDLVNDIVLNVLKDNSNATIHVESDEKKKSAKTASGNKEKKTRKPRLKSIEEITCPVCGKGNIIKGKTAYGCSEFRNGCNMRLPFESYPADLTPAKLNSMIKKAFKQ